MTGSRYDKDRPAELVPWESLNLFCRDCRLDRWCSRRTSREVEGCRFVRQPRAADEGSRCPLLNAPPAVDPDAIVRDLEGKPVHVQRQAS